MSDNIGVTPEELRKSAALGSEWHQLVGMKRTMIGDRWGWSQNHPAYLWVEILGAAFDKLCAEVDEGDLGEVNPGVLEALQEVGAVCQEMFESGRRNGWL